MRKSPIKTLRMRQDVEWCAIQYLDNDERKAEIDEAIGAECIYKDAIPRDYILYQKDNPLLYSIVPPGLYHSMVQPIPDFENEYPESEIWIEDGSLRLLVNSDDDVVEVWTDAGEKLPKVVVTEMQDIFGCMYDGSASELIEERDEDREEAEREYYSDDRFLDEMDKVG